MKILFFKIIRIRGICAIFVALVFLGASCQDTGPTAVIDESIVPEQGAHIPVMENRIDITSFDDDFNDVAQWDNVQTTLTFEDDISMKMVQVSDGILFYVETPAWDMNKIELDETVRIHVAGKNDPQFPPINYGNQFGWELGNEQGCTTKKCTQWLKKQKKYRETLASAFEYQFSTAPWAATANALRRGQLDYNAVFEGATPAAGVQLSATARTIPLMYVKRQHAPTEKNRTSFEGFLAWDALPPIDTLTLDQLRIGVEVSSSLDDTKKIPLHTVALAKPRTFTLGACEYPLEIQNLFGETIPGYIFPSQKDQIDSFYTFENSIVAYQDQPVLPSPIAKKHELFSQTLETGETVCGPWLAVKKEENITRHFTYSDWFSFWKVLKKDFEVTALPSGGYLILNKPFATANNPLGAGADSGLPALVMQIWYISPKGEVTIALDMAERTSAPVPDAGVVIATDRMSVHLYRQVIREGVPEWDKSEYLFSQEQGVYVLTKELQNMTDSHTGLIENLPEAMDMRLGAEKNIQTIIQYP